MHTWAWGTTIGLAFILEAKDSDYAVPEHAQPFASSSITSPRWSDFTALGQ